MDKMSTKGSRVYKCFLKQRVNSKDEAEITGSDEFHENPIESIKGVIVDQTLSIVHVVVGKALETLFSRINTKRVQLNYFHSTNRRDHPPNKSLVSRFARTLRSFGLSTLKQTPQSDHHHWPFLDALANRLAD